MSPNTIPEEGGADEATMMEGDEEEEVGEVVISPPSPEQKGRELPTPPPE
jgi:cytokinesis protein